MPKTSPIAAILLIAGTGAAVAQRPSTTSMSCARAAAYVRAQGAVVLGTGGMTYDRFVSDRRYCTPTEQTRAAFVPAGDTPSCFVGYTCYEPFIAPGDSFR